MTRRRPTGKTGWDKVADLYANPVPGDIMACLGELGLSVNRIIDEEAHMRCPAHLKRVGKEDRHPSFSVNLEEGIFGCFSCGFAGRFYMLVMEVLSISQERAMDWCRERGGVERAKRLVRKVDGLLIADERDTTQQINEASLALYVQPPDWALDERDLSPESCEHYGVLWDEENEYWIVTIRDPKTGRLWGWQEKGKGHFKNYPYNIKKGRTVFGLKQAIASGSRTGYVVESPLDVPRGHTAGYDSVVATYGAKITHEQVMLLMEHFDVIVWALDNDEAGQKALKYLLEAYRSYPTIQRVAYYKHVPKDVTDIGEMTDAEIYTCFEKAYSATLYGKKAFA